MGRGGRLLREVPSFCGAICRRLGGMSVPGSGLCVVVVAVFGGMPCVFPVVLSVFRGLFRVGVKIFLFVNQLDRGYD